MISTLNTGDSTLTKRDTLQLDKREENPPTLSFLSNQSIVIPYIRVSSTSIILVLLPAAAYSKLLTNEEMILIVPWCVVVAYSNASTELLSSLSLSLLLSIVLLSLLAAIAFS